MKFILLIYNDPDLLDSLPAGEFDDRMRHCFEHADELKRERRLTDSRMLESVETAKSVRTRNGRTIVMDGPFTETKELLAGFNVIEAEDMDEALRIAAGFPWTHTGCVEVRPIMDMAVVRQRVGA